MNIEQLETIIDRYLAGLSTPREKAFVSKWLETLPDSDVTPEDARLVTIRETIWQSVALHTDIANAEAIPKKGLLRQFIQRRTWWQYAAAVLILLSGSIALYNGFNYASPDRSRMITALPGSPKKIVLPDSSTVHLFPGSTVTIPENYNHTDRHIISKGRVFFEVKPDAAKPFYVHSGQLRTRVLGTSFEVMAKDSIHTSVIVRTGKVGVQYGSKHLADLTPGKRLQYDALHNTVAIEEVNAPLLCEWWSHGMVFNQTPLEEVVRTLSNWYNKPIEIATPAWKSEPVTVRIKQHDLSQALSLLSKTLGFHYRQQNNRIIIY